MNMIRVYRIQDDLGRGPFRPGFSQRWADEKFEPSMESLPTWMDEFGADLIQRLGHAHEHFGTGVRTREKLSEWFSAAERGRLEALGFSIVCLPITRILAEGRHQLVFARRQPLNKGAILLPWREAAFPIG